MRLRYFKNKQKSQRSKFSDRPVLSRYIMICEFIIIVRQDQCVICHWKAYGSFRVRSTNFL